MFKARYLVSGLISFFLLFSSISLAYAGGGPVEFNVSPQSPLNPGEEYTLNLRVYADGPWPTYCKGCTIHLKFENPQSGDSLTQSSERTDDEGRLTAKAISKIPGVRQIYVADLTSADGKAIVANSRGWLNYKGESPLVTPVVTISSTMLPTPVLEVVNPTAFANNLFRSVLFKLSNTSGADSWQLWVKEDGATEWENHAGSPLTLTNIYAYLDPKKDYSVRASIVKNGTSIQSEYSNVVRITRINSTSGNVSSTTTNTNTNVNTVVTVEPSTSASQEKDQLTQKIASLEAQLDESKKKQNVLEERLNDLVNFIKQFFPFFK